MNSPDIEYTYLRSFRFRLSMGLQKADKALSAIKGIKITNAHLEINYYATKEFFEFLIDNPKIDHLLLTFANNTGQPQIDIVFDELALKNDGVDGITLDYENTEIPVLTATYSYQVYRLVNSPQEE